MMDVLDEMHACAVIYNIYLVHAMITKTILC
jgi:hypothetical protein